MPCSGILLGLREFGTLERKLNSMRSNILMRSNVPRQTLHDLVLRAVGARGKRGGKLMVAD
jgi:hypothetical protein